MAAACDTGDIGTMQDIFAQGFKEASYWWDLAPRPRLDEPAPPDSADVVVIGSGNVGLSAALTLARGGRDVLVLDAEAAGHGASTRNAGYLGRTVWFKYGDMVRRIGRESAGDIAREAVTAHDFAAGLIRDEQIACFYKNTGRLIAAPSRKVYEKLERDLDMMKADGVPVEADMIPPGKLKDEVASDLYHGGQVLHGNGLIHPGLYHQGLLDRARAQGASVIGYCPVTRVERQRQGFVVSTARGRVAARDVMVATNGYTPKALPWHRRRVVPVEAFNVVTDTIDPALMKKVLPRGRPMIENRNSPLWLRPTEDGTRLLFGGTTGEGSTSIPMKARQIHGELLRVVPDLEGTKLTHCWSGQVAFPFDFLPHNGFADGIHYAMGWCASGVPMGTWLGHKTAQRILGDSDARTALTDRPFRTIPFYRGNPWFLPLITAWMRRADRKMMRD